LKVSGKTIGFSTSARRRTIPVYFGLVIHVLFERW